MTLSQAAAEADWGDRFELLETKEVSDQTFEALRNQLSGKKGMVDLVPFRGLYNISAMLTTTDRFPLPGVAKSELTDVEFNKSSQTAIEQTVIELDFSLGAVVAKDAKLERVLRPQYPTDFEGPTWVHEGHSGYLIFTSRPGNSIYSLSSDGKVAAFLEDVFGGRPVKGQGGFVWNANGTTLDGRRRVVFCAPSAGAIIRLEKNGSRTILAERFEGRRLNTPNDLIYRSDGLLYFTDSGAALKRDDGEGVPHTGLYLLRRGSVQLLRKDFERPNGLAFSPGENYLYVIDTLRKHILRFDAQPDGSISNEKVFVDVGNEPGNGILDGMKVDEKGNVYATAPGGVWVITPTGQHIGTIVTTGRATNVAFGGDDRRTLYITGASFVDRIRIKVVGIRP
jgi:gluconolactonase